MEVIVWNTSAISYNLENPSIQQPVALTREAMEADVLAIAASPFCS